MTDKQIAELLKDVVETADKEKCFAPESGNAILCITLIDNVTCGSIAGSGKQIACLLVDMMLHNPGLEASVAVALRTFLNVQKERNNHKS